MKKWMGMFLLAQSLAVAQDLAYETVKDKAKIEILSPTLAQRKTAKIRLHNGLEAFLISDPGVPASGAALAVEAGSWEDPEEYPGMAHFLEHMLFMGNAAFPKEFEYMWYINDHGGINNAYTASDRTVYEFSINNDSFQGAMERFSHFFIDPLFLPSCIGRELHAVDQEHGKNIENDAWREYMILKETGNPVHPNAGFSTGNAKTLGGIPQEALKTWYAEQYSANRMHLFAVSSLPIDEMVRLTVQNFSAVPVHPIEPRNYPSNLLSEKQKGSILYIKPVKDLKTLSFNWQVPKAHAQDLDTKALKLVAYTFNSRADNSLSELLKREKLAESVHANIEPFSTDQALFRVEIELTEQGVAQIPTVIEQTFQMIARLKEKGIPSYIFDEISKMALLNYQLQSREDVFEFVSMGAAQMVYEDLETFPEKTLIPTAYDRDFTQAFIQTLTAQECLFVVMADPALTGVAVDKKEKWMNAEYTLSPLSQSQLTAWTHIKPTSNMGLPAQNPYIPKNLTLVSVENPDPVLLTSDAGSKIYYSGDQIYQVPELAIVFNIKTPLVDGSAKQTALLDLYLKALHEKLNSAQFFGSFAGLNFSSGVQNLELIFAITGYSDKAPLFTQTIVQSLKNVSPTFDQFEIYKRSMAADYENSSKELPIAQAMQTLSNVMVNDAPLPEEKLKALQSITYKDFRMFADDLFKQAYVSGLFYGNLTSKEASTLWQDCKTMLAYKPYTVQKQTKKTVLTLHEGQKPFLIAKTTPRQGNGVLLMLEEGPFTFANKSAQAVLSKALREGFFDTLRTKQQTAYMAKSWDREIENQLFQFFAVQSISHQATDLLARFDLFLEDFVQNFQERISPERFETIRQNIIQSLEMPPENLQAMASRLNRLAFQHEGDFQWIAKEIEGLKNLSYDALREFTYKSLSRSNSKRIAVLMEGTLPSENDFRYETASREAIRGAGKYVSAR